MLSVSEAQSLVLAKARALSAAPAPISHELLRQVLAEDVVSDIDMPPFDKSLMDGFAVRSAGTVLRPQEFGVLATVGRTTMAVIPRPRVAILCTGDEIVDASQKPEPGQIRNGNGPMLQAQEAHADDVP